MASRSATYCTPQELAISARANAPLRCFTRDESIVLSFLTEAGVVSFLACMVTYALIVRNVRYYSRKTPGTWRLIKVPMDIYLLSLFAADMCIGFGGAMNAKWVHDGKSQIGQWCTAQAVILGIGLVAMPFNIIVWIPNCHLFTWCPAAFLQQAIAVHTFVMVWMNKGFHSTFVARIIVAASWLYGILYVAIAGSLYHDPDPVLRPSPYWCWFGKNFVIHRLWAGYIGLWSALFVSVLLYVPLFFWGRGNITVGDTFWSFQIHHARNVEDDRGSRRRSLSMIAYPLVYACLVIPLSVGRWIGFVQESHGDRKVHIPSPATISVQAIYTLSGACNVILFLITRPNLLLFKRDGGELDRSRELAALSSDADSIEGGGEKEIGQVRRAASEI